jgi:hypothetical protein
MKIGPFRKPHRARFTHDHVAGIGEATRLIQVDLLWLSDAEFLAEYLALNRIPHPNTGPAVQYLRELYEAELIRRPRLRIRPVPVPDNDPDADCPF